MAKKIITNMEDAETEKKFIQSLSLSCLGGLWYDLKDDEDKDTWTAITSDAIIHDYCVANGWSWDGVEKLSRSVYYFRGHVAEWGWCCDPESENIYPIGMDEDYDFMEKKYWMWTAAIQAPELVTITTNDELLIDIGEYIDSEDPQNTPHILKILHTLQFLLDKKMICTDRINTDEFVWKTRYGFAPTNIHHQWFGDRGMEITKMGNTWIIQDQHHISIPYIEDDHSLMVLPRRSPNDETIGQQIEAIELLALAREKNKKIILCDGKTIIHDSTVAEVSFEEWIIQRGMFDWEIDNQLASLIEIKLKDL